MRAWLLSTIVLAAATAAAQSVPAPPDKETRSPLVIRSGVELVQVDTVVTDGKGRHVTDLRAEDFEILEDGRPQEITNCEYVETVSTAPAPSAAPRTADAPLSRDEVKRAMAIVVDDLGIAFQDIHTVRDGLRKFIDTDVSPGDMVAIVRTSGGMGILQQFTTDKGILRAAAAQIRYNGLSSGGRTATEAAAATTVGADSLGPSEADGLAAPVEGLRRKILALGTLRALEYVIQGLRTLPGRKSVVLFSSILSLRDHFQVASAVAELGPPPRQVMDPEMVDTLKKVTDLANRASVVMYTVDPRGLQVIGPTGADVRAHMDNLQETTSGLATIATETGGLFMRNSNDLSWNMRQVAADQKGYYLIGYVPSAPPAKRGAKLDHDIRVKVKRPGLRVRARSKYSGSLEPDAAPAPSAQDDLLLAAASPFARSELALRLTPVLLRDAKDAHLVRTFMHVDGRGLSFEEGTRPGQKRTRIQVSTATFGDNGVISDLATREVTFPLPADRVEQLKAEGLILEMNLPVRKAGVYQIRAAVRDPVSGRIGSARQFLHVPPIKKDRLALSGVVLSGLAADGASEPDPEASPALRRLKPGMDVMYAFVVYGAKSADPGDPGVSTELRLFHENELVSVDKAKPAVSLPPPPRPREGKKEKAKDVPKEPEVPMLVGSFRIAPAIEPGEYTLEVKVTDPGARPPHDTATQRIDFEIAAPAPAGAAVLPITP
jgi:VWFA-related protein